MKKELFKFGVNNSKLKNTITFSKMLEYNPIPTNKSQHKEGVQSTFIKRVRNKKYKNVFNEIKKLKK